MEEHKKTLCNTDNTDNSITKCIKKKEPKKICEEKKNYEIPSMFSKEELQVLLKLFP